MEKKIYESPVITIVELDYENSIASSGSVNYEFIWDNWTTKE